MDFIAQAQNNGGESIKKTNGTWALADDSSNWTIKRQEVHTHARDLPLIGTMQEDSSDQREDTTHLHDTLIHLSEL